MALVAHFDLELHQMDVKTAFLNGDLHEDVYMAQPQGFKSKGQEHLVCKLNKFIYGLEQASRQWYLKFDEVMKKHNFIKNQVDQCVYLKMSRENFIILVLYVDDILLASNNIDLLHESKCFLSRNFDMKDLVEASYVFGIEIHRDRANGKLGLSQKAYIERVLNRFNMQHCSPTVAPVIKGDVFGSHQCPKTEVEYEEMKRIPYASVVGSLTYAQICTRPDITYICGMLGRFQSNPSLLH
ncbi:putative zinc finger, CCHC-type containing protein [Tanacetum coccineum]